jgi:hypothetical protein
MSEKQKWERGMLFFLMIISLVVANNSSFGQTKNFNIYVRKSMYSIEDYFIQNNIFKYYNILGENYIDPRKTGDIDSESVCTGINLLYPNRDSFGYLVLDIENKVVKDFKKYPLNDYRYIDAFSKLKELISLVKELRPNLKISLYGLPYRVYFSSQNKWNDQRKLDPLLSMCDFIAPSLYILYPNKEKGSNANESYLKQNLKNALVFGKRLDKPVLPFVWYAVSPGNSRFGGEVLEKQEMVNEIELIRNFIWEGIKVEGVIWWEPSERAFQNLIKLPQSIEEKSKITKDKNVIIREYTEPFLKLDKF